MHPYHRVRDFDPCVDQTNPNRHNRNNMEHNTDTQLTLCQNYIFNIPYKLRDTVPVVDIFII